MIHSRGVHSPEICDWKLLEHPATIVVNNHDDERVLCVLREFQSANVVQKAHVAEQKRRRMANGGYARGSRDKPINSIRSSLGPDEAVRKISGTEGVDEPDGKAIP
jgi:hypothetical protein